MTYYLLTFTAVTAAIYGFTGTPIENYILGNLIVFAKMSFIEHTWFIQIPWITFTGNIDLLNLKDDFVINNTELGKNFGLTLNTHKIDLLGTGYKVDDMGLIAKFFVLLMLYYTFYPSDLINKINRTPTDYEKFIEELLINKNLKDYPFPPEYYGKSEFTDNVTSDTLTEKLILEMKNKVVNLSNGVNNTGNNNITSVETVIQDNTNVSTEVKNILQEGMDTLNLSKMEHIQNNIYDYTPWDLNILNTSNIENIGGVLYTNYFYLFIMAGFVLLVAMVGAIILTLYLQNNVKRQDVFKQTIRNYLKSIKLKN